MSEVWQPMAAADLPAVTALADRIHLDHPEAPAVFAERLKLFPSGCFVLAGAAGVVGYAIAHPGLVGAPPPLDTLIGGLPERADCLYLHDIAITPESGRRGRGTALLARLLALAAALELGLIALVAVNGSTPFWHRLGFRPADDRVSPSKLASYGNDARYMVRPAGYEKMPDGL